jgi:hypothetical protein
LQNCKRKEKGAKKQKKKSFVTYAGIEPAIS